MVVFCLFAIVGGREAQSGRRVRGGRQSRLLQAEQLDAARRREEGLRHAALEGAGLLQAAVVNSILSHHTRPLITRLTSYHTASGLFLLLNALSFVTMLF